MNDTQQVEYKRPWYFWLQRFFSMPKVYVSLLNAKDPKKPSTVIWAVEKNEGRQVLRTLQFEDKDHLEHYCTMKIELHKIIKMAIFSLL